MHLSASNVHIALSNHEAEIHLIIPRSCREIGKKKKLIITSR